MNVRYTRRALTQIDNALTCVAARSPQGAIRPGDRITALVALLQEQPYAGGATTRPNVRRISTIPYPWLIDYRVTPNEIIIMRFRHAARRPLDV